MREIHKVAILGAGTMGARIAAHLANASIPGVPLHIVPESAGADGPKTRNLIAQSGLDAAGRPLGTLPAKVVRLEYFGVNVTVGIDGDAEEDSQKNVPS